jgi:hypothetical protein
MSQQLADLPDEELPGRLMEIAQQASEKYRQHLLEIAVHDPFDTTLDQYKDGITAYTDSLENKIDDYADLAEEQGRALSSQDLLHYVESVFPIPLKVKPSDLRGLSIPEATDFLLERLERAYHEQLCDRLLRTAQARVPASMKLDQVRVSDVSGEGMEALVEASSSDADESARRTLVGLAQGKGSLIDTLLQMNALSMLDLNIVRRILAQAVTTVSETWAQAQLDEIDAAIAERKPELGSASEEELTPHLLGVIYGERADFDKGHLKRVSFAPRLPLEYLALPLLRELAHSQVRDILLGTLETALVSRQVVWGRQELARLGQYGLRDLDSDFSQGLAQHLGHWVIEQAEEKTLGELDDKLYGQVRVYLGIEEMQGATFADVGIHDQLVRHLQRDLAARLADPDSHTEEQKTKEIEEYLLAQGYFEDTENRDELLRKPIAHLDKDIRDSIAALKGEQELADLKDTPVAQWNGDLRQRLTEYLRGRGHFVDEQKVQRFFVHGTLEELGGDAAREACAFVARRRLEKFQDRTLSSLKGDLRGRVLGHLQLQGLLVDEAKRARVHERPLSELDEAATAGLVEHLGRRQLEAAGSISALPGDALEYLQRQLRASGFFSDQELLDSFHQTRLSELEGGADEGLREHLLGELEKDLNSKLFGELPPYIRKLILSYLRETDYLLYEDKVAQFESLTLSALDAATLHEMEQQLGDQIVADLGERKFMNLDQEVREAILHYLDLEGLFTKKKKREQFVKKSLAEVDQGIRDGIAYHLGRERQPSSETWSSPASPMTFATACGDISRTQAIS